VQRQSRWHKRVKRGDVFCEGPYGNTDVVFHMLVVATLQVMGRGGGATFGEIPCGSMVLDEGGLLARRWVSNLLIAPTIRLFGA